MSPAESSRFVLAAPHTGAGKTTVTAALIAAFRRRGLDVRPFKVGPDYIDPGFLTRAAGRPARNLDAWLLDGPTLRWVFAAHAGSGADCVAVVEGMMGLFDGLTGRDDAGSTAHVARLLGLPVIVVLDASRAARSVAAVARGCQVFDRRLTIAGWVLNRVAGEVHRRWVAEAVERATRRPVLGSLPDDPQLALPERHLGLVQAHETPFLGRILARLAHAAEQRFDLPAVLRSTRARVGDTRATTPRAVARMLSSAPANGTARNDRGISPIVVAWARDAAFSFHYTENIEVLEALGVRVAPWSPLADRRLPLGTAAIVLGGGYPELFAEALADNRPALEATQALVRMGGVVYAECGGLMYLAGGIASGGRRHRLSGIVRGWVRMTGRTRVAYVRAEALRDTILAPRGTIVRGHEFRTSVLSPSPRRCEAAYRIIDAGDRGVPLGARLEGYSRPNVLASYVHLNFLSDARLAARFAAACRSAARALSAEPSRGQKRGK